LYTPCVLDCALRFLIKPLTYKKKKNSSATSSSLFLFSLKKNLWVIFSTISDPKVMKQSTCPVWWQTSHKQAKRSKHHQTVNM
jgi:hypothetical protein